jgi:hypothetical protein
MVKEKGDRVMAPDDQAVRLDRRISAVEGLTNRLGRLIRLLEPKNKRTNKAANPKMRRAPTDQPIVVTPIVLAAVKRTLAKISR